MSPFRWLPPLIALHVGFHVVPTFAQTPQAKNLEASGSPSSLATQIESALTNDFKPDAPGASVLVIHQGEVIFRRAYGLANVELNVPMSPDHVFRLGSITKQFTAVAILQLVAGGRLTLDDEVVKYIPNVETGGNRITLRHLLTHTSGLPSYTDQPEFRQMLRKDMTLDDVLCLIKGKPAHFTPGTDWRYCNTGFYLLGAVVEKVSGKPYGEYVAEHLFKPAGMENSAYDDTEKVIPRRASGYTMNSAGNLANATFVSMTQPGGAGGLLSTVDDLWKWDQALVSGKLVDMALLNEAWSSAKVLDGRATGYGFGWDAGTFQGRVAIGHGGAIQGFQTREIRIPDSGIYVAVLGNSDRSRAPQIVPKILKILLGPPPRLGPETLAPDVLRSHVSVYRMDPQRKIAFEIADSRLQARGSRGVIIPLKSVSADRFVDESGDLWYQFLSASGGGPARVLEHRPQGPEAYGTLVNEPLELPAMAVPGEILDRYVGVYQLSADFQLTVNRAGDALTAQGTGQPKADLIAESLTRFRIKQVPAQIDFTVSAENQTTGLVLHQGGMDLPAKKVPASK